ncbi:VTC domain-containing protein [Ruminococcus sp. YE71]|nr:polyphosphate polymerase domain-containing protein [Ruminococcus sp. YE78]SDA13896.1 VTC domain-containing protein [Ruminococcus sp. YE78]SFW20065.1 VTC domain-containing protein [Ruminococcus sp. YE71]
MAQEVFKRTEKKYLLTKEQFERLSARLDEYMKKDRYFESDIMSVYYDTPDYRLIRASLDKPVFKEKVRLRTYGVPTGDSTAFLEYKRKYKGIVYKRRTFMELNEVLRFIDGEKVRENNPQIENELRYAFRVYEGLAPRMLISYHRLAYSGIEDPNLRITFDDRIIYRGYDLDLRNGIYGRELLKDGQRLMEIKIPNAMPLWLSHILDDLKIFPSSFSKYGKAYTTLMIENRLNGRDGLSAEKTTSNPKRYKTAI